MSANSELLDHYVERYNAGDLDACMDLYAEDAVQRMHDGAFEGWDAIRNRPPGVDSPPSEALRDALG